MLQRADYRMHPTFRHCLHTSLLLHWADHWQSQDVPGYACHLQASPLPAGLITGSYARLYMLHTSLSVAAVGSSQALTCSHKLNVACNPIDCTGLDTGSHGTIQASKCRLRAFLLPYLSYQRQSQDRRGFTCRLQAFLLPHWVEVGVAHSLLCCQSLLQSYLQAFPHLSGTVISYDHQPCDPEQDGDRDRLRYRQARITALTPKPAMGA